MQLVVELQQVVRSTGDMMGDGAPELLLLQFSTKTRGLAGPHLHNQHGPEVGVGLSAGLIGPGWLVGTWIGSHRS